MISALVLAPYAVAAATAPVATAEVPPPARYVVVRGDTQASLAARALADPGDWPAVARLNHLDDPGRLPVGRVLVIPAALLRREPLPASIAAFSGQVTLDPGGAARLGLPVATGATITTGANSFVTLALADGSHVTLPSQSQLRVTALERIVLDGRLERRFELVSGRSDFAVSPRERPGDRFLIKTPVAVAAVRGTEFHMAHFTASNTSTIGVLDGEVASRAAARPGDTAVAAGSGAVLGPDGVRARPLLAPPQLLHPGDVQDDPAVVFTFAADPVPGPPRRRHLLLARDAGFIDQFAEIDTLTTEARFDNIEDGTEYVRVTSIDADGVEGVPAEFEIERLRGGPRTSAGKMPSLNGLHRTRFRWRPMGEGPQVYRFVLARDAALKHRVIDVPGLATPEYIVRDLAPGTWYWRVIAIRGDGARRRLQLFPVRTLTIARPES